MKVHVSRHFRIVQRVLRLAQTTGMLLLAACTGGRNPEATSNSYPDGKTARSLPQRPAAESVDWMQQEFSVGEETLSLNYSTAVLSLDIVRPDEHQPKLDRILATLYPDMGSALEAAVGCGTGVLPSIDMLDVYQKYTDDRLLAALELELSTGDIVHPGGRQQWLAELLAAIPVDDDPTRQRARAFLATAIRLGGSEALLEPQLSAMSARMQSDFERNLLRSSVIGFYSQSEGLSAVFRRDRFLQGHSGVDGSSWLGSTPAERLALLREIDNALSGSIALRDAYNDFLAVQSLITNPPALGTLNELSSATEESRIALFPHSRSLEEELFTGQVIANPMDFLRRSLLDGSAELKTTDDSGWYDYQQQALETLLLPERGSEFSKLALSPAYVARLEQAFEATITQRRETQSKNLMAGEVSAAPRLEERPALHLEPAPTLYLRTARAYRFLHDSLAGLPANAAGNEQLDWLLSESAAAMRRYYAMHCLSCADIGLPLGISPQELAGILPEEHEPAAADPLLLGSGVLLDPRFTEEERLQLATLMQEAADWLALALQRDPQYAAAMAYDPRVCVPAAFDASGIYNWGVIGVRLLLLESAYVDPPVWSTADELNERRLKSMFAEGQQRLIPVYEYADFKSAAPLSREQFRQWCDQSRSKEEFRLVANAYGGTVGKSWLEQYGVWIVILICLALFRDRLFPGIFGAKKEQPGPDGEDGGESPAVG